jgi:hypothetical protein
MGQRLFCTQCGSRQVERLPADGISPLPGHVCCECGAKLRAHGTTVMYCGVLVICVAIVACLVAAIWADAPVEHTHTA